MRKTAQSFPPIETWMTMSEGEQDAIIQAIDASRKRRSLLVPVLAISIFGTVVARVFYFLL